MVRPWDSMEAAEAALRRGLAAPLPGHEAQRRMARLPRDERGLPYEHQAGVLVLLFPGPSDPASTRSGSDDAVLPVAGAPHVVLTLRPDTLRRHAGQVSFPGGVVEPGEDARDTALREAREEVGLDAAAVEVLGELTPLLMPHTGFVLHPIVALARRRPDLRPDEREVAAVLEVPLADLADPGCVRREPRTFGERLYEVPYFDVAGQKVWGATAMVLAELLEVLGVAPSSTLVPRETG